MNRTPIQYIAMAATFLLAALLFMDATTFALTKADPVTGRERGCYTNLALLLGAKRPLEWEWTRYVELTAAGLLLLAGTVIIFRSRRE